MISVLILTKDEELNLPRCLEASRWCDDIVVLDSGSSDRTVAIAEAAGARVFHRPWDNEAGQRRFSLGLPFKYPWVYNPDADEIADNILIEEMRKVAAEPNAKIVAYRVRFKNIFLGKWVRHSSLYPTWIVRLFRPEKIRFEREINLRYCIDGDEGRLQGHLLHYSFNKGLHAWFEKHNYYSTKEAEEALKILRGQSVRWRDFFSGSPIVQRKALKEFSFKLPFRSSLRFLYSYFFRLGILDGRAGLTYCRLLAQYEYMITLKVRELRLREKGLPI